MNISTKSLACPQCDGHATLTQFQHLTASGNVGFTLYELQCPNGCRPAASVIEGLWSSNAGSGHLADAGRPRPTDDADAPADDLVRLKQQLAAASDTIANLEYALGSSRRIGMALGILMATYRCTDQAAFDILKTVSQRTHTKLRDVADALVFTGDVTSLLSAADEPTAPNGSAPGPGPGDPLPAIADANPH